MNISLYCKSQKFTKTIESKTILIVGLPWNMNRKVKKATRVVRQAVCNIIIFKMINKLIIKLKQIKNIYCNCIKVNKLRKIKKIKVCNKKVKGIHHQ